MRAFSSFRVSASAFTMLTRYSPNAPRAREAKIPFLRVLRENGLMTFADRAAQNEELFRTINERIEEGAKQHGVDQSLPFHCECCNESCLEKIELPPAEYDRIAAHVERFVLVPGHERADVESVVEQHSSYLVVEKTGEARAEIEREHPRPRHSD
jgi:hypothetical protein